MRNPESPTHHEPGAVRQARKRAGLTQTALAERLGVSLTLISQIETGKSNATPQRLEVMAGILGCPVTTLQRKRRSTRKRDAA